MWEQRALWKRSWHQPSDNDSLGNISTIKSQEEIDLDLSIRLSLSSSSNIVTPGVLLLSMMFPSIQIFDESF
jgi:hypothetical protein